MDLHQLEYMIAIEQEQSISKAAEKLYITQSALNQQLLRLEKELGLPLFERRNRAMIPTYAGRIYLTAAHQMLDMKKETYKILHEISDETAGEISVAFTPEQGGRMFSDTFPEFHKKYPNITLQIHEVHVKKMEQLLLQHETTLAFMTRTGTAKIRIWNISISRKSSWCSVFPPAIRSRTWPGSAAGKLCL